MFAVRDGLSSYVRPASDPWQTHRKGATGMAGTKRYVLLRVLSGVADPAPHIMRWPAQRPSMNIYGESKLPIPQCELLLLFIWERSWNCRSGGALNCLLGIEISLISTICVKFNTRALVAKILLLENVFSFWREQKECYLMCVLTLETAAFSELQPCETELAQK